MNTVQMTRLYHKHKEIISSTVIHFWLHHGSEQQELQSEALSEFVKCCHEYKRHKSKFKTWLINRIKWRLTSKVRLELSRNARLPRIPLEDVHSKQRFNLTDFVNSLSDDATMLVLLAFEIHGVVDCPPRMIRTEIKQYLRQAQWTHKRIKQAFAQIKEAL